MTRRLQDGLDRSTIEALRRSVAAGLFPGIDFATAMKFLLNDGVVPKSGLPVESVLRLEEWAHDRAKPPALQPATYSTTELKNHTGEIVDRVMGGEPVFLTRHGRIFAELRPVKREE